MLDLTFLRECGAKKFLLNVRSDNAKGHESAMESHIPVPRKRNPDCSTVAHPSSILLPLNTVRVTLPWSRSPTEIESQMA